MDAMRERVIDCDPELFAKNFNRITRVIDDPHILLSGGRKADLNGAGAYRLVIDNEKAGIFKEIVECVHQAGRGVRLASCGTSPEIMNYEL